MEVGALHELQPFNILADIHAHEDGVLREHLFELLQIVELTDNEFLHYLRRETRKRRQIRHDRLVGFHDEPKHLLPEAVDHADLRH